MERPAAAHGRRGSAARDFSTRFLPSDGIPEYNALLDSHLGKRREFLLGNRKSLELLQQTGVVARVQSSDDNPNQYLVYMSEKPIHRRKRLPPSASSGAASSSGLLESAASSSSGSLYSGGSQRHQSLKKSDTTPQLIRERSDTEQEERDDITTPMTATRQRRSVLTNSSSANASNGAVADKLSMMKRLGRSVSTSAMVRQRPGQSTDGTLAKKSQPHSEISSPGKLSRGEHGRSQSELLTATTSSSGLFQSHSKSVVDARPHFSQQREASGPEEPAAQRLKKPPLKGTVEHLLECDASYMTQIRVMRDQLADLDQEKSRVDAEVTQIRKRLRGVNAVQENDVAVAHCSAIMQHRLSKAEEEYMKLLTAQLQVRKDVDRVRRELTSLKKVRKKLEVDIEDVRHLNTAMQDKIRTLKTTRNVLFGDLVDLEKKAELAVEEQRLNLPPEEAVIVDVEKLMSAVQERNSNRRAPHHNSAWTPGVALAQQATTSSGGGTSTSASGPSASKPRLSYQVSCARATVTNSVPHTLSLSIACCAAQDAFQVIQKSLGCSELAPFIDSFVEVEEQLLSKYKATLALEEEAAALQKEVQRLANDAAARHASIRGNHQVSATLHDEMQAKIRTLVSRMEAYNELREVRNHEHARVRSIMQRCLEVLQAESLLSGQESIAGPMLMSELPSPALLEALQKKMTEVAMVMKVRHRAKIVEGSRNYFQAGRDAGARRSNMFSTREASVRVCC